MNRLVGWIYQIALLLAATFVFMILFQFGTTDFKQHAADEFAWARSLVTHSPTNSAGQN